MWNDAAWRREGSREQVAQDIVGHDVGIAHELPSPGASRLPVVVVLGMGLQWSCSHVAPKLCFVF